MIIIFRGMYMKIPYVFKKCNNCGKWLVASIDNFYKSKGGKYGLEGRCKECRKKQHKQYRDANKEKRHKYHKQWQQNNKKKVAKYSKQYYQSPQGQVVDFNKRQKRRIKEEEQGTGITKEQWLEMMNFFDWKCAYSGETLTKDNRSVDHIIPLNSGGDNMIWNCAPMTRNLNSSKCDKDMLEWYREQDFYDTKRLDKIYEWQEYAFNKWYKEEK